MGCLQVHSGTIGDAIRITFCFLKLRSHLFGAMVFFLWNSAPSAVFLGGINFTARIGSAVQEMSQRTTTFNEAIWKVAGDVNCVDLEATCGDPQVEGTNW